MASSATSAQGTLLKRNGTTIAEVTKIDGPKLKLDTDEVTSHSSGGWREHIATLLEGGEVGFDLNFLPAETTQSFTAGLLLDMVNRTLQTFSLVFTDSAHTTWSFTAFVTGFETDAPFDKKLTAKCKLKISGTPTLA